MNRFLYALHRWLAAAVLGQLVVWVSSGLFFAAFPIERVHGEHAVINRSLESEDGAALVAPSTAIALAIQAGVAVDGIELRRAVFGPVWVARGQNHRVIRLDARTGAVAPVARDEAELIARADQRNVPSVVEATLIERDAPVEYRDHPLPAWRVVLDDKEGTVVWVDAWTADVTARRNDLWRWYDFLWSLHIMDYRGRESFHHPLLIIAAVLAGLAIASGGAVWIARIVRRIRRMRKERTRQPEGARSDEADERPTTE